MNPFTIFKKSEPEWVPVGLMSSFPEVGSDDENLVHPRSCKSGTQPGCRVFDIPKEDITRRREVPVQANGEKPVEDTIDLQSQVLVFRHRGKMHAVDNVSHMYSFLSPFMEYSLYLSAMSPSVVPPVRGHPLRHRRLRRRPQRGHILSQARLVLRPLYRTLRQRHLQTTTLASRPSRRSKRQ